MDQLLASSSIISPLPPHEHAINRGRPRANTEDLESPRSEPRPENYTEGRVQAGIDYADRCINSKRRKPSPILEKLLLVYKGACSEYMRQKQKNFEEICRTKLLSEIRGYEEEMVRRPWVRAVGDDDSQKLQNELLKLRRLQFFARYGDYAQRVAHKLRDLTRRKETEKWSEISGLFQWSEISQRIKDEAEHWEAYGPSKDVERVKTTYAIYKGCQQIGMDSKQALLAIRTYGVRNEACHSPINKLVVEGRNTEIATTLADDERDLASAMPIELKDEEQNIQAIILELRDRWFTVDEVSGPVDGLAEPWTWLPKLQLLEEIKDNKTPEKRQAARLESEEQVVKGAARRILKLDEEKELVDQLSTQLAADTIPSPWPLPSNKKRKASQKVSVRSRKKAWKTIQDQQRRARTSFRASLELQRQVNRVVLHYKDQYGSSPPPQE
ncbi:hypothetical protein MMC16_004082 [Acarospora aff. strigata]|nr:hypothetical protein [Acarospora aff. strigata]